MGSTIIAETIIDGNNTTHIMYFGGASVHIPYVNIIADAYEGYEA